jgi:3',5'-cyclic AMP phosphodiesterase CpdA
LPELTRQLIVVHISDLHFGAKHRFEPGRTAAGDVPEDPAQPTLSAKLREDLQDEDPGCPVIICITGDLTETAATEELMDAEECLKDLARMPILGKPRGLESVFVVPGNHDTAFANARAEVRWQSWSDFFNRIFKTSHQSDSSLTGCSLHDYTDDLGAIVACLNSAYYVQKGKPDEDRGRLDTGQLTWLENELAKIPAERLGSAIRIALLHHHPVLIPALAEPGRGYDAVHGSGLLLSCLRRYGFHVILHGHKHNPHTFTDDVNPAFQGKRPF